MNKIKNSAFTFVIVVLVQLVAFGQDPGDFGGVDSNPTDAPIDKYLWVLLLFGLGYVFYKYKNRIKSNTFSNN
jgi:hypothetical protein